MRFVWLAALATALSGCGGKSGKARHDAGALPVDVPPSLVAKTAPDKN